MTGQHRITEEILKKTLANKHEAHPKDIKLKDFTVSEGSNKGDGYACEMKKVDVTSEIRDSAYKDTFIYKCVPMGDEMLDFMKEALIVRIETVFYTDIAEKLNKIALNHGLEELAIPKVYYGDHEEGILAMQDLKEAGYRIKGNGTGMLGVPDIKMLLRELAKIHGLSYHFIETYFGGVERFRKDYWYMNSEGWSESKTAEIVHNKLVQINFTLAVMVLEESSEHKHLLEPLRKYVEECYWQNKYKQDAPNGPFTCLLHNDAWCNNIMYRDSPDGSAQDICLIDFQLMRRARPAADLAYGLVTSMAPEARKGHLNELLTYYHKELMAILSKLGYTEDIYTFGQLKEDYVDAFPHGFSMGILHALLQHTDPAADDSFDLRPLLNDDTGEAMHKLNGYLRAQARTNEEMRQKVLHIIQEARDMKIF